MKKNFIITFILFVFLNGSFSQNYHFDGSISEEVLNNYLDRAVTASELLVAPEFGNDAHILNKHIDVKVVKELKAKFVGRAIFRWGKEDKLNDKLFFEKAKQIIDEVHSADADVIFQACLFEAVFPTVSQVAIPSWVFEEMNLPVEDRNFKYDDMLADDGKFAHHWTTGGVPDITKRETQLWFLYLAGSYMNIGIECLHLGQINLIGWNDKDWSVYNQTLTSIRNYAKKHARRHYVILDAHNSKGMLIGKQSLIDFISFPLRLKEIEKEPMKAEIVVGNLSSVFQRHVACVAPSGWETKALPTLVEFDNFGIKKDHENANVTDIFPWGYDEISWFYLQPLEYKKEFLKYAYTWLKKNDPVVHLQMPVARVVTLPEKIIVARAAPRSEACPYGMDIVKTIKKIWKSK